MAVNQQQLDYLNAMGIPVWISRGLPIPEKHEQAMGTNLAKSGLPEQLLDEPISVSKRPLATQALNHMTVPSAKVGMQAAGELIKDLQQTPARQIAELAASLEVVTKTEPKVIAKDLEGVDWIALEKAVNECTVCDLHEKRQHPVFGKGSKAPTLMIVGDIPRLLDEQQKQPFAGETGELLDSLLSHLEVSPDDIYFTNLLKCRTPLDNPPQSNQAASCLSYLKQQIKLLQPQLVLLMGRSTAQQVLGQDQPMAQLRQKQHQLQGIDTQFIVTYHPAYLLRQPRLKALVWQDLQLTKQMLIK